MSDHHEEHECKCFGSMSRRGFIATMGVSAAGVAASGKLFAAESPQGPRVMAAGETEKIILSINGRRHEFLVEPRWTLLYVLREVMGLTGTKEGCSRGECGACTVLIDDVPRYACMTLAVEAEGSEITTLEGLMDGEQLGPVQQAFAEEDAFQCGYCTPGQIMATEGLLRKTPDPTPAEIQRGVSGNLCRCGAYVHILKAVKHAAGLKRKGA